MSLEDILYRARAYPYDSPPQSYLYQNGSVLDFQPDQTINRTPVLAFGSNKSPEQLRRKFGNLPDCDIPVEYVKLHDFDIVFAAHITSYGAVPAMLQHCKGVVAKVALTWLDDQQLEMMHKTELYAANYSFGKIENILAQRDHTNDLTEVCAYIGERGHLSANTDGHAYSIAQIPAEGRIWPATTSGDLLEMIRDRHAPDLSSDEFILNLVQNKGYRRKITEYISIDENSFIYPYTILKSAI